MNKLPLIKLCKYNLESFVARMAPENMSPEISTGVEIGSELYNIALAVEKDSALNKDMKTWDVTSGDGIDKNETW